jgi:hypothetical protein
VVPDQMRTPDHSRNHGLDSDDVQRSSTWPVLLNTPVRITAWLGTRRHSWSVYSSVQLGDVPTWVASIVTTGTLSWPCSRSEPNRFRHKREEQESIERHCSHAELIAAVPGPEERPPTEERKRSTALVGRTAVDLVNSSPQPVYSLVAGIVFVQGQGPSNHGGHAQVPER